MGSAIPVAVQHNLLLHRFPFFRAKALRTGYAEWIGDLQPSEISAVYSIKVVYVKNLPKVWVLSPDLKPRAPHLYKDRSLCLYWPQDGSWTPECILADTIVPWTAFWLYYYEIWLDTNKWVGPESPHKNLQGA